MRFIEEEGKKFLEQLDFPIQFYQLKNFIQNCCWGVGWVNFRMDHCQSTLLSLAIGITHRPFLNLIDFKVVQCLEVELVVIKEGLECQLKH